MSKEMKKAPKADGEKLRQLTGKDHGPVFLEDLTTCDKCESEIEQWWNYCAMCGFHLAAR